MTDHYFSADPSVAFARETFQAKIWGRGLTITTGAGVYSKGHLDVGTAVLLQECEPPRSGRVLDLGCGYGVIGLAIAAAGAAEVIGVEVNARAVLLAAENAVANGLDARFRSVLVEPEAPADAALGTFDEIWSNPPIRIGKPALHALLLRWLPRLTPAGRARLVVGKNLGGDSLQRWLTEQGWPTERVASSKGFRVLEVRRA